MSDITDVLHEVLELTCPQLVLDTSALVADPDGVFAAYGDRDLVVPLAVLEELDGLKKRLDPVGRAAREVLRTIERLRLTSGGDLTAPVDLPDGGTLRVALNGVDVGRLREHGLDEDKPDNRIIGVALGLVGRAPKVTVVSADAAVRLKAATFGLEAIEQEMAVAAPVRQAGWSEHQVSGRVIDAIYAGSAAPEAEEIADALPANTFAVLQSGSQSVLVRRRRGGLEPVGADVEAWGLRPRNKEQRFALAHLLDPSVPVVALDGRAGTGKTLCAVAAGLEQVVEQRNYARLCVYRPVIPVGKADLGYLPGALDEKLDPWMAAISDAVSALTERRSPEDARQVIDAIKASGQLVMESVAHLRGRTLHNSFVIVDEAQNLPPDVIKTILTRLGDGSKVVFTGDTSQIDAAFLSEATCGLSVLVSVFTGNDVFGHVRLTKGERSRVAELAATLL
ncbi:MAG TPA: PhoH family protein [Acidimicrobiales bacterium]|nr:PhoH family protein [Acidimicrobiales bacterium]